MRFELDLYLKVKRRPEMSKLAKCLKIFSRTTSARDKQKTV
jgi:hypothetical protein